MDFHPKAETGGELKNIGMVPVYSGFLPEFTNSTPVKAAAVRE